MKDFTYQKLKIYCDGGARGNPGPSASAFVVFDESKNILYQEGKYWGRKTNNQAEYLGLIAALEWISKENAAEVQIFLDSELVTKQMRGEYKIKNKELLSLALKAKELIKPLPTKITFEYVSRDQNSLADGLVNQTLDQQD